MAGVPKNASNLNIRLDSVRKVTRFLHRHYLNSFCSSDNRFPSTNAFYLLNNRGYCMFMLKVISKSVSPILDPEVSDFKSG